MQQQKTLKDTFFSKDRRLMPFCAIWDCEKEEKIQSSDLSMWKI